MEALERQFSETGKYDDFVLVKDISRSNSACEHRGQPVHRQGACRLYAGRQGGRAVQARAWSMSTRGACRRRST